MLKSNKNYQLDIFGNEISLEQVKFKEECSKKWKNKLKKYCAKYFDKEKESGFYGTSQTKYRSN